MRKEKVGFSPNKIEPEKATALELVPNKMTDLHLCSEHWFGNDFFTAEQIFGNMYPWDLAKHFSHAVRDGDMHLIEVALRIKPNLINSLDERLMAPISYAIKYQRLEILKFFIAKNVNLNSRGHEGLRPIHIAAIFDANDALKMLLRTKKVKIDVQDDKGQTALHVACKRNHVQLVQILLSAGANLLKLEKDGTSVMHHAARNGSLSLYELLNTHGAPFWIPDNNGATPIMVACMECRLNILEKFIAASSMTKAIGSVAFIINRPDKDGSTCLHHATQNRYHSPGAQIELLNILLEAGADINARRNDGNTSLHIAASLGFSDIATYLLKRGALPNILDKRGRNPMHECALSNQNSIAEMLIEYGVNINATDDQFFSPLHWACRKGHENMVTLLLKQGAKLEVHDVNMRTALHLAVMEGHVAIVNHLLTNSNIAVINKQDMHDRTALHYAAEMGEPSIVQTLLDKGADFQVTDSDERRPIHLAARSGSMECLQILVTATKTSKSSIESRDNDENTAALLSAEEGRVDAFRYLCEVGADFSAKDDSGRNSLMLSAYRGNEAIVRLLLDKDLDVNVTDANKNSALHYAAKAGDPNGNCVRLLLEYGAQMIENNNNETPIDFAVLMNNSGALDAFFDEKNWLMSMNYRRNNGKTHMDVLIKSAPHIAKKVLDYSITASSRDQVDKNYAIVYNFGLIDPGPDDPSSQPSRYIALSTMAAESKEDLLHHPLCNGLIQLKWTLFARYFFWIDMLLYVTFMVSLTAFVLDEGPIKPSELDSSTGCRNTSGVGTRQKLTRVSVILEKSLITAFLCLRIIVEVTKLFHKRLAYFTHYETYYYCFLYASTAAFMYPPDAEPCLWNWIFAIPSVVLCWSLVLFQIENIPYTGLYSIMFQRVLLSLVKVILIFGFFIIGFSLAFYISMRRSDPFSTFVGSLLKTIDMAVGELEYVTYFFSSDYGQYQNYLLALFVLFVIMIPIALMNLLIGVAVGDIDGITREAGLRLISIRINLIYELETSLPTFFQRKVHRPFFEIYPNRKRNYLHEACNGRIERDYKNYLKSNPPDTTDAEAVEERLKHSELLLEEVNKKIDFLMQQLSFLKK